MSTLSIVVVNYHTDDLLLQFLDSLAAFSPDIDFNVRVQDVEAYPKAISVHNWPFPLIWHSIPENCGYAAACNDGVKFSKSKYFGFFNADTRFINKECLEICVDYLESHDDVGAVGPLQTDSNMRVTHAGIIGTHEAPRHRGWLDTDHTAYRDQIETVTISGSAFITPRAVWEEMSSCPIYQRVFPDATGALLPTPLYYEETGYMYHLWAHDWKVMYLGDAHMIHEWNQSPSTGGQQSKFHISRDLFRGFCDEHGIPRD